MSRVPRPFLLAPSILSADPMELSAAVRAAEEGGADLLHVDIMDGHFVPNLTFGPHLVKALRSRTRLPLDIHLMVSNPGSHLESFAKAGGDVLAFHAEVGEDLATLAQKVRDLGKRPGLAVRPDTPFERVEALLPRFDEVIVMTVMPGFSGQKFMADVLPKMRKVRDALDRGEREVDLEVDGGIGTDTLPLAAQAGANLFVCGNSVYAAGGTPQERLRGLRSAHPSPGAGRR